MILGKEEQRVYNRMQLNTAIVLTAAEARVEGVCRNLSAQGVLVEMAAGQCQLNQQWQLEVPSADSNVAPLKATATVLRIDAGDVTDLVALTLTEVR